MSDLIYFVSIIAITASLGKKVFAISKIKFDTSLEGFIFSSGLGLGILSYAVLGIGLAGWLYKWTAHLLLALLLIVSFREFKDIIWNFYKEAAIFIRERASMPKTNLIIVCLSFILSIHIILNLISCLAPPSASDPLTFQLVASKIYIQRHRISYLPQIWLSNNSAAVIMPYVLGMLLSGDHIPALIHWFFGILILLMIILLCKKHFKEGISLLAGTIFYSLPLVTFESTSAFVELGLTLFGSLAVYAFLEWMLTRQRRWLILSGVFAGFAAGAKYLGLISILAISIILAVESLFLKKAGLKKTMMNLTIFGSASSLAAFPWYLKSWVFTGNPFFPFFFNLFGGRDWNLSSARLLRDGLRDYGLGLNLKSFFLAPWNITIHGRAFDTGDLLGPLFLSFLPFLALFWKDRWIVRIMAAYSALYYPFWFFMPQQARFLLPLTPFLSIMTAYIVFRLFEFGKKIRYSIILVTSISLLFNCAVNIIFDAQFLPVVFGIESKDEFLSKKTKFYNELMYINQSLPKSTKILIWVKDGYYLDRDHIHSSPAYQGLIDYARYDTPEELLSRLKELGVTHILKPKKTTLEDIRTCSESERQLYRLQYEMEEKYLVPIYKKRARYVEHRTLLREPKEVDVFIYEIRYP